MQFNHSCGKSHLHVGVHRDESSNELGGAVAPPPLTDEFGRQEQPRRISENRFWNVIVCHCVFFPIPCEQANDCSVTHSPCSASSLGQTGSTGPHRPERAELALGVVNELLLEPRIDHQIHRFHCE